MLREGKGCNGAPEEKICGAVACACVRQRSRQHGVPSAANFSLAHSVNLEATTPIPSLHLQLAPFLPVSLVALCTTSPQVTSDEPSSATGPSWRVTLLSRLPASFGQFPILQSGVSVHRERALHRFVPALSWQRCRASTFGTVKASGITEFSLPPAPQARMHLRLQGPRTPPFRTWQKRLGLMSVEDHSVLNSEPHGRNLTSGLSVLEDAVFDWGCVIWSSCLDAILRRAVQHVGSQSTALRSPVPTTNKRSPNRLTRTEHINHHTFLHTYCVRNCLSMVTQHKQHG
jgi:hypothetical protein